MGNGGTPERRQRQAQLIRRAATWVKFTGPSPQAGKERVACNPWCDGHWQQWRELSKLLNAEIRQAREPVSTCAATNTVERMLLEKLG